MNLIEYLPLETGLCLLCNRRLTNDLYDYRRFGLDDDTNNDGDPRSVSVIQDHKYVPGAMGGYKRERCIMGDQKYYGLVSPFLKYDRNDYAPFERTKDGARILGWVERAELFR